MNPPSQILKQFLLDTGVLMEYNTSIWPCFLHSMPDKPDQCACVVDTGSLKQGRIMRTGEVIEKPSCQVQFRSMEYSVGRAKAMQAQQAVDQLTPRSFILDSTMYRIQSIRRTQSVLSLGAEPGTNKRRELFTLNVFLSYHLI